MKEYIEREAAVSELNRIEKLYRDTYMSKVRAEMTHYCCEVIKHIPAADVVPWEWLERYADYFCAGVSMPEFVREAKMFYESSNKAMQGGVIDG